MKMKDSAVVKLFNARRVIIMENGNNKILL